MSIKAKIAVKVGNLFIKLGDKLSDFGYGLWDVAFESANQHHCGQDCSDIHPATLVKAASYKKEDSYGEMPKASDDPFVGLKVAGRAPIEGFFIPILTIEFKDGGALRIVGDGESKIPKKVLVTAVGDGHEIDLGSMTKDEVRQFHDAIVTMREHMEEDDVEG